MALNFGSLSKSFTQVTTQLNSVATKIQPITAAATQGLAQVRGLASQAGTVSTTASQLTNGFSSLAQSNIANVSGQISNLSGAGRVNVNQLLGTAATGFAGSLGQLGAIGNVVSNFTNTVSGIAGAVRGLTSGNSLQGLGSLLGNFDFEQFAKNIINVVPRDFAQLAFAVGGEFDTLRQRIEAIGDVSNLGDFVDLVFNSGSLIGGSGVATNNGASKSKIPNPLRDHNGFNYVISLGLLGAPEYNIPESYRSKGGLGQYIIRSGGGFYNNRYQVLDELGDTSGNGAGHAEYYIEDLEIDAVIAPNPNTSVAMGTTIRFTVVEPYSMGNFIQAIVGSVQEKGFENSVNGVPFCLQIDFVGWNEDGQTDANFVTAPIFIPINIINMEFNVTGQGSTYQVQAVAYPDIALSDSVNQIFTDVESSGAVIYQVLNGETNSVTSAINERIDNLEQNDVIAAGDRYIIAFPKDLNAIKNALQQMAPVADTIFTTIDTPAGPQTVEVANPSSQMFEALSAYARNEDNMNEIGLSVIIEDTAEGGNQSFIPPDVYYDPIIDIGVRSQNPVLEKFRTYSFSQGDSITNIIEDIILKSRYAAEKATEESAANGTRQWFKIDTQVYIDNTAQAIADRGRAAKIYVYNVIPYFADEAKFLAPNQVPKNTEGLKKAAVKEYNYIYTGLNEDVMEFDLTFNNAFLQTALANFGLNPGPEGHFGTQKIGDSGTNVSTGAGTNRDRQDSQNSEPAIATEETIGYGRNTGSYSRDVKLQVAEMFHDRLINQPTDLITAEMKIFGDPFFLPQQTGNYVGQRASGSPNLTTDGTMAYLENELLIVVNFKTPFDYQIEGATMEFPQVVSQFSGIFTCWAVTNNFSKGRFEQTLKLIRRIGQNDQSTTGNTGAVVIDDTRSTVTTPRRADRDQQGGAASSGQDRDRQGSGPPPVARVNGVTFDPRTDLFQPPSRTIDTPAGSRTIQPPPIRIYDDAIFRASRTQLPSSLTRPPVNSANRSNDPGRVGTQ